MQLTAELYDGGYNFSSQAEEENRIRCRLAVLTVYGADDVQQVFETQYSAQKCAADTDECQVITSIT
jgi:hypothetical protein